MSKEQAPHSHAAKPGEFRLRGEEVSRLEGFSDAVFAFALTLLVVSLEVPRTYKELMAGMRNFPAFAVCFFLLMDIWFEHYHYYRRYGLHDGFTRRMNAILLFLVLFYVYPLKFLFTLLIGQFTNREMLVSARGLGPVITTGDFPPLMTIYGLGAAAVFTVFALLYRHAYKLREELELNELEVFDTRASINHNVVMLSVPLVSVAVAVLAPLHLIGFSGWAYFLYAPAITIERTIAERGRRRLEARLGETAFPRE